MNPLKTATVLAAGLALMAATAVADSDKWVQETGDLMSGSLGINTTSGFALFTYPGDSIDIGGDIYKGGRRLIHGEDAFGDANTSLGIHALASQTIGCCNTAVGYGALGNANSGGANTAVGYAALGSTSTGSNNAAVGLFALAANTTGIRNTAIGGWALSRFQDGVGNIGIGYYSFREARGGNYNIGIGTDALWYANSGSNDNVALGRRALMGLGQAGGTGSANIAVGPNSGSTLLAGSSNIFIGHVGGVSESGTIRIGTPGFQNDTFISGIWDVPVAGVNVQVDADGKLGVLMSARRFKEDIADIGESSARLLELRPVSFRYKPEFARSRERPREFGLVAEEVAEVMPELVVYDDDGRPETVRYQHLIPLLLNELQRQHAEIARLSARTAEQDELLRRLGDQPIGVARGPAGASGEAALGVE